MNLVSNITDCTQSSTRQDEWPLTFDSMQQGNQEKSIRLDVGIKTETLESSSCLHKHVIDFVTDVLETTNENISSQEQHVINVILQEDHTGNHNRKMT